MTAESAHATLTVFFGSLNNWLSKIIISGSFEIITDGSFGWNTQLELKSANRWLILN